MERDFRDVLVAFNEAGVEYVVVGAYAVAVHGLPRATGDLDLFVRCSDENARRVAKALAAFGAPPHLSAATDFSRPNMVVQIGVEPVRVDIMTSISGVEFDDAASTRLVTSVEGLDVPCLGRECLIRNKRSSGRKKDLLDAEWLEAHPE
ncbi:MAG: nucleotidyltransferase [Gemmatimonadetes bacterium]|nr:nucleotidyltransferase [Gemmatimonadota bacterium]